ncbi:MAG TPA: MarR family transcriptional regulator, partial [Candidatus Acidoferrales bacterium]|nr:MarR family transcriptional regulator [Candidatus Acidoferrales bacterium]
MARRERPDELRLEAWRSLLMAAVSVRERLEQEMVEERGLPLTWYEVMLRLQQAPGRRLRMQELAQGAVVGKSALTQIADRMVEAGLVRRETCRSDRRGVFLVLSAAGRRAF